MSDEPQLLYLEPDDEVTAVVRRARAVDAGRLVLVAPGRSRVTASAVSLRLLARVAEDEGRPIAIVTDAAGRSLAAEAGIPAYASVEDARLGIEIAAGAKATRTAPIRVVRGDEPTAPQVATAAAAGAPAVAAEETTLRPVPARPAARGRQPREHRTPAPVARPHRAAGSRRIATPVVVGIGLVLAALVAVGAAGAMLLPAATIHIVPAVAPVGPAGYEIVVEEPQVVRGEVTQTVMGSASGTYEVHEPATGAVTFRNFNVAPVAVPAGTRVAAGDVAFVTTAEVTVPPGSLTDQGTIRGGEGSAPIVAEATGPAGNVAAEAIDTVLDAPTRNRLRLFPQNEARLAINYEATAGGLQASGPVVTAEDVEAAVTELRGRLLAARDELLGTDPDAIQLDPSEAPEPVIDVPEGLVETTDQPTFELTGSVAYDRLSVARDEVEELARAAFLEDRTAVPAGRTLLGETVEVTFGDAARDGERIRVEVTIDAMAAADVDESAVVQRVAGMPVEEAQAALADLGEVAIETWPGWVTEVPGLDWRVEVRIVAPDGS